MRIAITGGTGFVGRNLAERLLARGHEVVLISRGVDRRDLAITRRPGVSFRPIGIGDADALAAAFAGCEAVAHCAGINRPIGRQTYRTVHVEGTRHVVQAARAAGVGKIALLSFLRARPDGPTEYHRSKWEAEQIVRAGGLEYTILKCGVIYGRGDHMLDHLSHAMHTFPIFAMVGYADRSVRPIAVEDVARILAAALTEGALSGQTVAVLGPQTLTFRQAVERVAEAIGRRPWIFRMPVAFHYALAWCAEQLMTIPLVSVAQVRMLAEGLVEALPPATAPLLQGELSPRTPFTLEQIRRGLPPPKPFGLSDCRWLPWRFAGKGV